ncbi:prolactin-like [Hemicordylus capensis]|uniref:prolactin-like n=1 Tax=Hemicordylus capensis TaxID=884348 RepID=UPI002304150A|nr:prolactin-like [Hemicordylus capensis]
MRSAQGVWREGAAWQLFFLLWVPQKFLGVRTVASCSQGDCPCRFLSVSDLFDRMIQHSNRIHRLSTALFLDLEKYFLPGGNVLARSVGKCHTSWLLTPSGKEYTQKIPREELTHLILRLLQAWKEPLSHFDQSIVHDHKLPDASLSKAKQISNMVQELETGVEKVTEKMQSMGIFSNSLHKARSSEAAALFINNEANLMSDYEFIHCFRRDSNKVQNYLKVLKCRIMPGNIC